MIKKIFKTLGLKRVKRKKHRSKKKGLKFLKIFTILTAILILISVSAAFFWVASLEIPSLSGFEARQISQSTKIYDRTGRVLLFDLHKDVRRTVVSLSDISRYLKNATIAIEDTEFYEHSGIKPKAILRSVYANLRTGSYSQGGSTITQQIVKNALLTRRKTIKRKIKE